MKSLPLLALLLTVPCVSAAQLPETFGIGDPLPANPPKPAFEIFSQRFGLDLGGHPVYVLPPVDVATLLAEDAAAATTGDKTLRYGVGRALLFDAARDGVWHDLAEHGRLWTAEIGSAGALGLRLHLAQLDLPEGAQAIVYAPRDRANLCGPFEGQGGFASRDIWTPTRFQDRLRIECWMPSTPPGMDPTRPPFVIDSLQHVYRDLNAPPEEGPANCHNDVTCSAAWANTALACAGIGTVNSNSLYCSGQMLNSQAGDLTPYWLTANHCLSTNGAAQSAEIYWRYQTSVCNGSVPSLAGVPQSAPCTLLATSPLSDFTLLMIEGALPSGLYWAGWTSTAPSTGTAGACIHHPAGTYKRISFGTYSSTQECSTTGHHRVNWTSGPTEPGSSGSGFFRSDTQQLVGQLHCGPSSCTSVTYDGYGRFADTYPNISSLLAAGSDDAQEDNDSCATARTMTAGSYSNLIVKSTDEDWYKVFVPTGAQLQVGLSFTHTWGDIDLALYGACGGAVLTSSTSTTNAESITYVNAGPGQNFMWRVYLYSDTRNQYSMNFSLGVANNTCATATAIGNGTYNGTTVGATNTASSSCGATSTSPDVWYSYTASCNGLLTLSTCGSALDTVITVWSACGGSELACNDDAPPGSFCGAGSLDSLLSLAVTSGSVYKLRVAGYNGATGTFFLTAQCQTGVAFCLGDGVSATACPCGNHSTSNALAGCLNSTGQPGRLSASGVPRLAADTVVLTALGLPGNVSSLFFQGTTQQSGGLGSVFGDGLRCAGGTTVRLGIKTASAGGSASYPTGGDASVHVRGLVTVAGTSRYYQTWYRNAAAYCTSATYNLTNGYRLTWLP